MKFLKWLATAIGVIILFVLATNLWPPTTAQAQVKKDFVQPIPPAAEIVIPTPEPVKQSQAKTDEAEQKFLSGAAKVEDLTNKVIARNEKLKIENAKLTGIIKDVTAENDSLRMVIASLTRPDTTQIIELLVDIPATQPKKDSSRVKSKGFLGIFGKRN